MVITELSICDMACLKQKNYALGHLTIGNCIYSNNAIENVAARSIKNFEIPELTDLLKNGRQLAFSNLKNKLPYNSSIINIQNKILPYPNYIEFIASGSVITSIDEKPLFSTHVNGQNLYALLDAGYQPISVVFGNIAYSFKSIRGFIISFQSLRSRKMKNLTRSINQMRHSALNRLMNEAKHQKANAVLCIETMLQPINQINEMAMTGSAVFHPFLKTDSHEVATSHLTSIETWFLSQLGYAPYRLLMHSNVYSLGFSMPLMNIFSFKEKSKLTKLISYAREENIAHIHDEAKTINADDVMGIKTYINHLGNGLIEFFTIGTAIKQNHEMKTESDQLLQESIIYNKSSYVDYVPDITMGNSLLRSLGRMGSIVLIVLIVFSLRHSLH
jgi:uncharacterized protein YbjQ (UPF0145 family)